MTDVRMVTAEAELQSARDVAIAFAVLAIGGFVCIGMVFYFVG